MDFLTILTIYLGYVAGCVSAQFYMKGVEYQCICGQSKGYQIAHTYLGCDYGKWITVMTIEVSL